MNKNIVFSIIFTILILVSSVNAQNIIWVSGDVDGDDNGSYTDDWQDWIDKLEAEGYTVDVNPMYWNVLTAELVEELNAADLVIICRANDSGTLSTNTAEADLWNSVTTPILNCSPYTLRNTRWKWINNGAATLPDNNGNQGSPLMQAIETSHPIFWGISLDENDQIKVVDPDLGSGNCSFIDSADVGNGTLIAKTVGNEWVWIAEWQQGVEFYDGANAFAGGHRMAFSAGAREGAAGGTDSYKSSEYNWTDEGWNLYLNAVRYMLGELEVSVGEATSPNPRDGKLDVAQDIILSWKPGMYVADQGGTHNVFFSDDFDDVNEATVSDPLGTITSIGQVADDNDFNPGTLELGKTYYWRVDEVNDSSSPGTNTGAVWSFTVEPAALKLPYESFLKVTAISSSKNNEPNDTVNEYGLDPNHPDQHSKGFGSWASSGEDTNDVWIQYDFDKQYKIHEMLVWNYNHSINKIKGFREVLIEYSEDGSDTWTEITDVNEFNKATGKDDYVYNTVVPFNDTIVKSVRITALTGWGSKNSLGLSEIRFTYIPVRARIPSPSDETTDVDVERTLEWRKGREAVTHTVYIGTDEAAVTNGTASSYTTSVSSYSPALILGCTYYWRVDEINNSMTPSVWEGNVWSFSTKSSILIDGFEKGYGDTALDAVYKTWKDGVELQDSTNGSYMGRSSPPYLHTINHSGGHSAPMTYDTLTHSYSEVIAQSVDLPIGTSNWSIGSPATLTIWFRGDPNTTEVGDSELYCIVGGKTAVYGGSIDILTRDIWRQWDIDLTTLGANLSNIPQITIGIRKIGSKGGSGVIYLDDISLTGNTPLIAYPDVFIEAENYKSISSPMEVNDVVEGASGGQYIHVKEGTTASQDDPPANGIATYEVTLDGGQYVIYCRVSIAAFNQDAFWIQVDGATSDRELHTSGWCQWNQIPFGAAWHWDDVHMNTDNTNETVTWTIPAGKTTIRIAYRDTDATNPPRLDALLIIKVGE